MYAFEQWAYLYYMNQMNHDHYVSLTNQNTNLLDFYDAFYSEYKDDCDAYVHMFDKSIDILTELKRISDENGNVVVTYGLSDPTLSWNTYRFGNNINGFFYI